MKVLTIKEDIESNKENLNMKGRKKLIKHESFSPTYLPSYHLPTLPETWPFSFTKYLAHQTLLMMLFPPLLKL